MKGRTMQLRWIGGGLAAVLAAGLMSAGQASAATLLTEDFNSYTTNGQGTAIPGTAAAGTTVLQQSMNFEFEVFQNTTNPFVSSAFTSTNPPYGAALGSNSVQTLASAAPNATLNPNGYNNNVSHPSWASLSQAGGAAPRFTLGHGVRTTSNWVTNGQNSVDNYSLDESPFSGAVGGHGLTMVDQLTNQGSLRRVQASFTGATAVGTVQTTYISLDFKLGNNNNADVFGSGAQGAARSTTGQGDDLSFMIRLFDSANQGTAANNNGNGFFLCFVNNVDAGDPLGVGYQETAQVKVVAGTQAGFNSAGLTSATSLKYAGNPLDTSAALLIDTWYHFDITTVVDSASPANDYALVTMTPFGGSPINLTLDGTNTHLPFKSQSGTGITPTINTVELGDVNSSVNTTVGIASFDNLLITDSPVPEPATLGLLALGTTLLLPRRARRA